MRVHLHNESEWQGFQLLRRYRAEFADFVEAYVYAADEDAVVAGFYTAKAGQAGRRARFVEVETPSLVLRDADGMELWLQGFSCGDIRSHESRDLLVEAGFDPTDAGAVLRSRLVRLAKNSDPPVLARDSVYPDRWYGLRTPAPCLVDDRPTMLMSWWSSADLLACWRELSASWMPRPTSAEVFPDPTLAEASGFADPTGDAPMHSSPGVWNFIVKDASARQVWMRVGRRQGRAVRAILEDCGFDGPYSLHRLLLGSARPIVWSRPV